MVEKTNETQDSSETVIKKSRNKLKQIHSVNDSLLSNASGFKDYAGFKNLTVLLLVLTNLNSFLQNVLKYGILVDPIYVLSLLLNPSGCPNTILLLISLLFVQVSFCTEFLMSKGFLTELIVSMIHGSTLLGLLVVPVILANYMNPAPHPLLFMLTLAWYTVLFLKIHSYHSVNKWCREEKETKTKESSEEKPIGPVLYPNNISMKDTYYFMLAPTLCYELNFPRRSHIDKYFLLKRFLECVFFLGIIIFSFQQWIIKTLQNSLKPMEEMHYARIVERLLRLAIPNHLIWLMFFYMFFHSFLNVLGELLYFGDRQFYRAWWNATQLQQFWGDWNIPIHNWCKRHIYLPLIRNGYSKWTSMVMVFFISAFFHEYIVAVPLKMIKPWAFAGMVAQIPFAVITNYMDYPWGNVVMWLSLIMGQPLAILMYYHEWYVRETMASNVTMI